jgi:hypothetical protein
MQLDEVGRGNGSMAAGARVKFGKEGVQLDEDVDKPIELLAVRRVLS